jgi:hypothetical protein
MTIKRKLKKSLGFFLVLWPFVVILSFLLYSVWVEGLFIPILIGLIIGVIILFLSYFGFYLILDD